MSLVLLCVKATIVFVAPPSPAPINAPVIIYLIIPAILFPYSVSASALDYKKGEAKLENKKIEKGI
ncbi:hypothetical protein A3K62_01280 [Candidatus Pacearchaeota archaeon RBG_16_35_8]|nr:MAG: hypothetical protein A3K62_01280 [Candidatus Pacearchaeota archaeon RBG_16_35_8]